MNLLLLLFIVIVVVAIAYNYYSANHKNIPGILNELKNASKPRREKLMEMLDEKIDEIKIKNNQPVSVKKETKKDEVLMLTDKDTEQLMNAKADYNKINEYVNTVMKVKKPIELHWLKFLDATHKQLATLTNSESLISDINSLRTKMINHNHAISDSISCGQKMCVADVKNLSDWKAFMISAHPDKLPKDATAEEQKIANEYANFSYYQYLGECKSKKEFCDKN